MFIEGLKNMFGSRELESEARERVLIIGDPHTGATTGLTPPTCEYDSPYHRTRRRELWGRFQNKVNELRPIHRVISLGDLVHGPSKTATRTEEALINEVDNQADVSRAIFEFIDAPKGVFVMGTAWHVGDHAQPVEQRIAESFGYGFHKVCEQFEITGVRFHLKHKISGSNNPRNLGNALQKEYNTISNNSRRHGVPEKMPHIMLRGHRHVFHYRGDETYFSAIVPCLQTWGGNLGAEMTSVWYPTVGLMWFDILDGKWSWDYEIWRLHSHLEVSSA